MKVSQIMEGAVKSCSRSESLNTAAKLMWDYDCGCVPVVNEQGEVLGLITDRDICMAAYTQGCEVDRILRPQLTVSF
jgi:CBS domain-containing protein